jgi:hypothetical protein
MAITLDGSNGITTPGGATTDDITFADNDKAIFGTGSDLQIYHDGSNSYVQDAGDGALILNTTNGGGVYVYSAGETMATFNSNGAVNLYYDNAAKLATTSTGIAVTGSTAHTAGDITNTISGTYNINGANGTAGSPAYATYSFKDDPNTGMYRAGTDALAFTTAGSQRMKIDASGRVTTPSQPYFSSAWNLSGTGFVTSHNVVFNNGNGFTITNGKIYVPVAGHYYINAYGIATSEFDTRVVANTTSAYPFLFDFRQSTWASGTHHGCGNGRVVYLASGSYVGIHRLTGTMYSGAGTSNPHNLISIMLMG